MTDPQPSGDLDATPERVRVGVMILQADPAYVYTNPHLAEQCINELTSELNVARAEVEKLKAERDEAKQLANDLRKDRLEIVCQLSFLRSDNDSLRRRVEELESEKAIAVEAHKKLNDPRQRAGW